MPGLGMSRASRGRYRHGAGLRKSLRVGIAGGLMLAGLWSATAADPAVRPYLGSREAANTLTREQLRELFFIRRTKWPDGKPVRVFVLPDQHPIHARFVKEVLGVYPYQLRAAWDRMTYSGTGVPPTVVEGVEEMHKRVDQTPGAIGYILVDGG